MCKNQKNSFEMKLYKQHRKNVENAKAVVDNAAPKLSLRVYIDQGKLYDDFNRMREIEINNQNLLKQINIINRTKGKVDSYLKPYMINSKLNRRLLEQQKIEDRNQKFIKSLHERKENTCTFLNVIHIMMQKIECNLKNIVLSVYS
uniref:Uncharacterized protein n=1 Tax=Clastoptera arizonana TaxID=38151 RepID=A0A1B6CW17_9HEMI